jgi:hypothetical protein
MKMACLFAALAFTGAVAPPKISLSLEGMDSAYRLDKPIYRDVLDQNQKPTGKVGRQDWTEKCPAVRFCPQDKIDGDRTSSVCEKDPKSWVYTDHTNCPFPKAKAYDHQDRDVAVTTRLYRIDVEGKGQMTEINPVPAPAAFDFSKRSTFLFKYDSKDLHGNEAEQVVFALILDDVNAPIYDVGCKNVATAYQQGDWKSHIKVEAVSDWELCRVAGFDNVDTDTVKQWGNTRYNVCYNGKAGLEKGDWKKSGDKETAIGSDWKQPIGQCCKGSGGIDCAVHQRNWVTYKEALSFFKDGKNGAGPNHVGNWVIQTKLEDKAGIYGHNQVNNQAIRHQNVLVVDTSAPEIHLGGSSPDMVECSKHNMPATRGEMTKELKDVAWYGDESVCKDKLDTDALGLYLPVTTTVPRADKQICQGDECDDITTVPSQDAVEINPVVETYHQGIANEVRTMPDIPSTSRTFKYECSDYSNNKAPVRVRTVTTVDTEKPSLILTQKAIQTPGDELVVEYVAHTADGQKDLTQDDNEYGAWAEDSCDATVTSDDIKMSWGPRPFNPKALGDYVRTYTVKDASENTAQITRTFTVVDQAIPIIKPVGGFGSLETYEASRTEEYVDKGATCWDYVDGELSHAVEVSGEVVNMRIPATYTIRYDCQDLSGNNALKRIRTVVVQDTQLPAIKLIGTMVNYVESGFPYVDAGAIATDSLDGDLTEHIWTMGNTVNVDKAFNSQRDCMSINEKFCENGRCGSKDSADSKRHMPNGQYKILNKFGRKQTVSCYFFAETVDRQVSGFTYHVHKPGANPGCKQYGMKKLTKASHNYKHLKTYLREMYPRLRLGNLEDFVCYQEDTTGKKQSLTKTQSGERKKFDIKGLSDGGFRASAGKYIISYHVADAAGNFAPRRLRTVVVKDTLPPVITLTLKNKLVHNGGVDAAGLPKNLGLNHFRRGGIEQQQYPYKRKSFSPVVGAIPTTSGRSTQYNALKRGDFVQQYNPAAYAQKSKYTKTKGYASFGNPNMGLMAEAAANNGWMVGAIASAVAGVALLSYSRKNSASVPV